MKKTLINKAIKSWAWLGGTIFFVLMGIGVVLAQTTNSINSNQETRAQKKETMQQAANEKKTQMKEQACETIERRIGNLINRYENNQQKDQGVFGKLVKRMEGMITALDGKGLDTSDLKEDVVILKEKVANLNQLNKEFIYSLKEAQQNACSQSGQLKGMLTEPRKIMPEIKKAVQDIRQFYVNTIRAHLVQIRNQWEAQIQQQIEQKTQTMDQEKTENQNTTTNYED